MSKKRTNKKNETNKYKIKVKNRLQEARTGTQKTIIHDYSYEPIEFAFENDSRTKIFEEYIEDLAKKHGLFGNKESDIAKIKKLINIDEVNKLIYASSKEEDSTLKKEVIKMFESPYPYISHFDYIVNKHLIHLDGYCEVDKDDKCIIDVKKDVKSVLKTIIKWSELLPKMEQQICNLFKGSYSRKQITIWQGFFRDKSFTPLISSFLEIIHYVEMREWNEEKVSKFLIKNIKFAFQVEKDYVEDKLLFLKNKLLNVNSKLFNNKKEYMDFFIKDSVTQLEKSAKNIFKGIDLTTDFDVIFMESKNNDNQNPKEIKKLFKKFVLDKADINFKIMNFYFITHVFRQNLKITVLSKRLSEELDKGFIFLNNYYIDNYDDFFKNIIAIRKDSNRARSITRMHLDFIENIYLTITKNIELVDEKTWKLLYALLKNSTIKHSFLGAIYINTINSNWSQQEKMDYFRVAYNAEMMYFENVLDLEEVNFYIWLYTTKYLYIK